MAETNLVFRGARTGATLDEYRLLVEKQINDALNTQILTSAFNPIYPMLEAPMTVERVMSPGTYEIDKKLYVERLQEIRSHIHMIDERNKSLDKLLKCVPVEGGYIENNYNRNGMSVKSITEAIAAVELDVNDTVVLSRDALKMVGLI